MNYAAITDESIAFDDYWLMVEDAADRLAAERRFGGDGYVEFPEPDEETAARCEAVARRYFGHPVRMEARDG